MLIHQKQTIYYGENNQQFGHFYKPKHLKVTPVVIVIHGGYWKDNHNLESYATSSVVDYLKTFDIAIWNLEYRRMDAEGENIKAPWPAPFQDVADGIDHLRTIGVEKNLDLNRILIIGHSAGGHLATWAASRNMISTESELYYEDPLLIQKTLSISGVLNLFEAKGVDQPEQIERLMGGTPQTHPARYLACAPSSLNNPNIDLTVVHGEQDTCVKVSQALHYCDKAKGRVVKLIMPDADHFSMLPHDGHWLDGQWQQIKQLIAVKIAGLAHLF